MEELMLLQPDETMVDEINAYRKAMINADSSMDGAGPLLQLEAKDLLRATRSLLVEETCPPRWVPATQFVCIRKTDGRIVGMIQVRHRFNDFLAEYGQPACSDRRRHDHVQRTGLVSAGAVGNQN